MRILMVLEHFFPPDIRVEKEARSLIKAGHEVFLACPRKKGVPDAEEVEGIKLRRVPIGYIASHPVWRVLLRGLFPVDPFWRRHLGLIIEESGIEALHVHDLPLVATGLSLAKRHDVRLVADLHEDYPEALRMWTRNSSYPVRLLTELARWQRIELRYLPRADRVITVTEEHRLHYINDCGCSPEKVSVVSNTEDLDYLSSLPIDEEIVSRYKPYFTLLYVGSMGAHRALDTAIDAMPEILKVIPNARLLLVGSGSDEPHLKTLVNRRGIGEAVEFAGWQPYPLVPSYIAASRLGLHTHIDARSAQSKSTSPNKVFQYMAMGKPTIVASSLETVCDLVTSVRAGLTYAAGDAHSLARAIITVYEDSDLADLMGQNGRQKVKEYDWSKESTKLCDLYRELGARST